jgi:hypothetical protein
MDGGEELTSRTPRMPESEKKKRANVMDGLEVELLGMPTGGSMQAESVEKKRRAVPMPQRVPPARISRGYNRARAGAPGADRRVTARPVGTLCVEERQLRAPGPRRITGG